MFVAYIGTVTDFLYWASVKSCMYNHSERRLAKECSNVCDLFETTNIFRSPDSLNRVLIVTGYCTLTTL